MTIFDLLLNQTLPVARLVVCGALFLLMIVLFICGFVFSSDKRRDKKNKKISEKNTALKKATSKKSVAAKKNARLQKSVKSERNFAPERSADVKKAAEKVISIKEESPKQNVKEIVADVEPQNTEITTAAAVAEKETRPPVKRGLILKGKEMSCETRKALGITAKEYDEKQYSVTFKPSFAAKLALSDDVIKSQYYEICKSFYSYKKTRIRASKKQQRAGKGKDVLALIFFKGKKLAVALNLDPNEYANTKYRGKDVSAKRRFAKTPMLLKITSERKLKYAEYLIDRAAEKLGFVKLAEPENSAVFLDADKEKLIASGEIVVKAKEIL